MIKALAIALIWVHPVVAQSVDDDVVIRPRQDPRRVFETIPLPGDVQPLKAPSDLSSSLGEGQRDKLYESDMEFEVCRAELIARGVIFEQTDPILPRDDQDCGILRPLTIEKVAHDVAVAPAAILRCEAALALAIWTDEFVKPAAQRLPNGGVLSAIENGSDYTCRRRNNSQDGKLSEHAFGNAIDVMGFVFDDGTRIAIEPREAEGTMVEAFQDSVRAAACLEFSTVLGPGSNASHDDHLHLDVVKRNGGYRLCEQGGVKPD